TAGDVNADGFADVVVGAPYWFGAGTEGRAYGYLGAAAGPAMTPSWIANPAPPGAAFGGSVAAAGDVNGDGFGDVLIGASNWSGQFINEGRAYLYLGSAAGLSSVPSWTADPTDQTQA